MRLTLGLIAALAAAGCGRDKLAPSQQLGDASIDVGAPDLTSPLDLTLPPDAPRPENESGVEAAVEVPPTTLPRVPYRAIGIASGRYHTCALLDDHQVKCWGYNSYGQLGLGDAGPRGASAAEMGNALPTVDLGTGRLARVQAYR